MSTVTIQLPDSLRKDIETLSRKEGYSFDQFLASAAAEKVAVITTLEYLKKEAVAGNRKDFENFLSAVPDEEPESSDRLP